MRLAVDVGDGRGLRLEHGVAEGADLLGHVCQATDGMPHYFDESPATGSAEATVHVELPDTSFTLRTDRGVFSHGRLDAGHGAAAARRARAAADGRRRSTSAAAPGRSPSRSPAGRPAPRCGRSTSTNGRGRCAPRTPPPTGSPTSSSPRPTTCPPTCASTSSGRTRRSASARRRCTSCWPAWLDRLTPAGRAVLVVHKHLGSDSLQRWLIEHGWPTTRLASAKGYRLLDVHPRPAARSRELFRV